MRTECAPPEPGTHVAPGGASDTHPPNAFPTHRKATPVNPRTQTLILSALALAAVLPAQTQTVRGEVEDVRNTQNQFYLKCTNIPLVSSTVDLRALEQANQQLILQVINAGTPAAPVLDVQSTVVTPRIMDMGNLRFGRSERWEVNADPGTFAMVFIGLTQNTRYVPLGGLGTLLLGNDAAALNSGFVNGQGQFQFNFTMPTLPQLLGTSVTSQALASVGGSYLISNPDCKEIENG